MVRGRERSLFLLSFAMLAGFGLAVDGTSAAAEKDVALSLRADRSVYTAGQRIVLTLTVTNSGDRPVRLTFPSAQIYDFAVRQDGREVWQWSRDRMFTMMQTEVLLRPGKPKSYTESWNQIDTDGKPLQPGTYEVVGSLLDKQPATSRSMKIEIK
jgi:hypothetical protein